MAIGRGQTELGGASSRAFPRWTWRLVPALLVCLSAPAFFVLQLSWLGWLLVGCGLAGAWFAERVKSLGGDNQGVG